MRRRAKGVGPSRRQALRLVGLGSVGLAGYTGSRSDRDETSSDGPSTLIATWRGHDPTDSVTLQWLAPADGRSDPIPVEVSAADGTSGSRERTDVRAFGESDLLRHRAELSGLEPDTLYGIAVDEADAGLSVRTAPVELTDPVTFAEGGDVGTSSAVPRLHERAASWDPLFGFVGGDVAYANGWNVETWVAFLEDWNAHMRSGDRLVPLVAAIGDHEVRGREFDGDPDLAPYFYSLFDNTRREPAYWALDVGDDLSILILDSNHTADVAGAQTEWLEGALAERADRTHLTAAYHIAAHPSAKPFDHEVRRAIRRRWAPLFEEYDLDVAFEHDDHAYKRTRPLRNGEPDPDDGVLYLGDGAWGRGPRDAFSPEQRPYLAVSASELHVIRVELAPDGSRTFRAVGPDGETIDRHDQ